jgi:hypothetical protein
MAGLSFDSLKCAEMLKEAGVPEAQAAAQARIWADILSNSVAFPSDLVKLESNVNQKVETMQLKMLAEIEKVRADTTLLKWMVGLCITLQITVLFKLF